MVRCDSCDNGHIEGRFAFCPWCGIALAPTAASATVAASKSCRWYVGTMNDAVFIIDKPPRPAPVDDLTAGDQETNCIAALGAGTVETCRAAKAIVAAHNEEWEAMRVALLDCQYNGPAASATEQASGWMDIESAPKDGTPIDIWGTANFNPETDGGYQRFPAARYRKKIGWTNARHLHRPAILDANSRPPAPAWRIEMNKQEFQAHIRKLRRHDIGDDADDLTEADFVCDLAEDGWPDHDLWIEIWVRLQEGGELTPREREQALAYYSCEDGDDVPAEHRLTRPHGETG